MDNWEQTSAERKLTGLVVCSLSQPKHFYFPPLNTKFNLAQKLYLPSTSFFFGIFFIFYFYAWLRVGASHICKSASLFGHTWLWRVLMVILLLQSKSLQRNNWKHSCFRAVPQPWHTHSFCLPAWSGHQQGKRRHPIKHKVSWVSPASDGLRRNLHFCVFSPKENNNKTCVRFKWIIGPFCACTSHYACIFMLVVLLLTLHLSMPLSNPPHPTTHPILSEGEAL